MGAVLSLVGRVLIGLVSGVLSWYAYFYLAPYVAETSSAYFVAWALVMSIFLHELGHAVAFGRYGIKTTVVFIVIAGGAIPNDVKRVENLSNEAKAEIALAGMFGNIAAVCAGALFYLAGEMSLHQFGQLANLNASLILFNLLPFGLLDGGRFTTVLFESVRKDLDNLFATIMAVAIIGAFGVIYYYRHESHPFLAVLMVFGLYRRAHDEPDAGHRPKGMHIRQQLRWAGVYTLLVMTSIFAMTETPMFGK